MTKFGFLLLWMIANVATSKIILKKNPGLVIIEFG
jgi:hypothetical protein